MSIYTSYQECAQLYGVVSNITVVDWILFVVLYAIIAAEKLGVSILGSAALKLSISCIVLHVVSSTTVSLSADTRMQ